MNSVKTIRAVERAFDVLRTLQGMPDGAMLIELQRATGLSGPTVLRLVKTLIGLKAVRRSTADQRYRTSIELHALSRGIPAQDRLADVAAPILDELCQLAEWPSDMAIHSGHDDFMMVLESSMRQSRFYVRRRGGRVRVNLLGSAMGAAFLSALPTDRLRELVEAARKGRDVHNAKVIASGNIEERLARARVQGYAARHGVYRGGPYNGEASDDALDAIAVPIISGKTVLGALNINWNRGAMSEKQMVQRNLKRLQEAARAIAEAAARQGVVRELAAKELAVIAS